MVGEGLCKLMGNVRFCREEELTRDVLLEFLKAQGAIKEVEGLVEVTVQTVAGASFGVMLEEGGGNNSNVRALKAEIEEAEGAARHRQELFMLVEGAEDGSKEPLSDAFEITAAEWDALSDEVLLSESSQSLLRPPSAAGSYWISWLKKLSLIATD